jgi:chemotaxis protein methyltransferase CheR
MLHLRPLQPYELTDVDYERISRLVYDQCGINLQEGKKELVRARLGKRMRLGQFHSFRDYYQYVIHDASGEELVHLLDSISTNFTYFFREEKHFQFLRTDFLPELVARKKNKEGRIRFWSAGCSSGEEPYSVAITLLEGLQNPLGWHVEILGTDISTRVLKAAAAGIYPHERIRSLPQALTRKYFLKGDRQWKEHVKVKDRIKHNVQFRRLNLKEPFHFKDPFDCIICRNVMIYFDKKTQAALVNRFYDYLEVGGVLMIGHSESLTGISHPFHYVRPTIYKK